MIRKLLSYLLPITVFKTKSNWSKSIEITWANGELVLDSENTNYSYGSLQRILRLGLKTIGFRQIRKMNTILVLGVAGGSVIKTLNDEIQFKGKIIGVEIDPEIIKIANSYFQLNQIPNLSLLNTDAFEFVLQANDKYDLIIVDIFQDTKMPSFLFENFFTQRLCALLQEKGCILFNTMVLSEKENQRNKKYCNEFYQPNFKIKTIPRVEIHNELIVIEKI
jgi:predicted O-methyltransferase YrrM